MDVPLAINPGSVFPFDPVTQLLNTYLLVYSFTPLPHEKTCCVPVSKMHVRQSKEREVWESRDIKLEWVPWIYYVFPLNVSEIDRLYSGSSS